MSEMRDTWLRDGCVVARGLWSPERTARLRALSERILAQWREENPENGKPGGGPEATSMRHLNHPGYFDGDPDGRRDLLEAVADPAVRSLCRELLASEPLFRCTSLFMDPQAGGGDGDWHRDTQFLIADEATERARIEEMAGVSDHIQLQIALVPSDDIEVVPGSHRRWDTPEEYRIRRSDGGAHRRENVMPGAVRIALEPGDAVAFNAAGLHRGRYHVGRPRRTFMVTVTRDDAPMSDYFSRQPWCLTPGYLDGLTPDARAFYERFVAQYRADWG